MSDHFSPWLTEQGHAPYAWSVLGAVAHATSRVGLMTYVTCPSIRYHPAVVAQKSATVQLLAEGRFTLGLGSGESLNEHVVGDGWPGVETRQEMLTEAVEIIRQLHTGELVTFRGDHFDVDSARIWDTARDAGRARRSRSPATAASGTSPRSPTTWSRSSRRPSWSRSWNAVDGAPRIGDAAPGRSVRSRSAGTPTSRRRSSAPTTSSAGSPAAGA